MSTLWFSLFLLYLKSRVQSAYSHSFISFYFAIILAKNVRDWAPFLQSIFQDFTPLFRNKVVISWFVSFSLFIDYQRTWFFLQYFSTLFSVESVGFACFFGSRSRMIFWNLHLIEKRCVKFARLTQGILHTTTYRVSGAFRPQERLALLQ